MMTEHRICGSCGEARIPMGVDWPIWKEGKPVCLKCKIATEPLPTGPLPNCPACGARCSLTTDQYEKGPIETVQCQGCTYDAGGNPKTEADAIRAHLLNCQRLTALVPVTPRGWKLMPEQPTDDQLLAMMRDIHAGKPEVVADILGMSDLSSVQEQNLRAGYAAALRTAPEWVES